MKTATILDYEYIYESTDYTIDMLDILEVNRYLALHPIHTMKSQ